MNLNGKRIVLGVPGGIAAYKSAELARGLIKAGAEVQVILTAGAEAFITPLTFQALTGRATRTALLDEQAEQGMGHIELARWAELILIAPATANVLARLNAGMADDLLTTVVLASSAPLAIAPAMNQQMWANAATQRNVQQLDALYHPQWLGPESGEQACGDVGAGRMMEPLAIVESLLKFKSDAALLSGKRVVITAGPTREAIDPVRYLTNHSSGKMGYALADQAARMGADVTLISGPVTLPTPTNVTRINVTSAREMAQAAEKSALRADLFIGAAAVADYHVANAETQKHKKQSGQTGWTLQLAENPDIIARIARHEQRPGIVVGFAAETADVVHYAQDKLQRKNLDWIVANDVSRSDIGFNSDDNQVVVFGRDGQQFDLPQQSKSQLAGALLALFMKD
ncbi:bifunctional phosphopantothenoylcysteine decarboxylase/phosphopantothenate--cysteine ligase CoaBC [Salinispirillum marinum]|uniref:Coenzyme A biosynthesis bifunctional protein CoaBC n=2 Tax=Saccharospirillaceae TaxID=255527 RepID=A0ABV8BDR6_9GAMM